MPKTCFVIGPIGDADTPIRRHADDFMEYIVKPCPALKECNYGEPDRADRLPDPGRITTQIIERLYNADLVIADLSTFNANVFYELAFRHACAKPTIQMALDGPSLPFDIHDSRTIRFTFHARWVAEAKDKLAVQIRRIQEDDYKVRNLITEAVGVISLPQSDHPDLSNVIRMLNGIENEVVALKSIIPLPFQGLNPSYLYQVPAAFSRPYPGFTNPSVSHGTGVSMGSAYYHTIADGSMTGRTPLALATEYASDTDDAVDTNDHKKPTK